MPEVDYNGLRFVLDLLQLLGLIGIGIYSWFVNRTKVNRHAIEQIERAAAEHARRLDVLDNRMNHAPTHQDLGQVYDRLNGVAETMSQLNGQLSALGHQLSMVNEYLLNRDGGRR